MDVNLKFIQVYPEWITRQCKIKESISKQKPIIECSQLSFELIQSYDKHIQDYNLYDYTVVINNNLKIGECSIKIEGE